MNSRNLTDKAIAPMHIDDREVERLLDLLDRAESKDLQTRAHPRIPYRRRGVTLSLDHPGGSRSTVSVWTRNLSSGGVSVLTGAFVHPASHCDIDLPRSDGVKQNVHGIVQWCRLIDGFVHEAGIRFEQELDLEFFLNVATLQEYQLIVPMPMAMINRVDLLQRIRDLMAELADRVEVPRLSEAMGACKQLQRFGEQLDWEELIEAATEALHSMRSTGSIARSQSFLRKLQDLPLPAN